MYKVLVADDERVIREGLSRSIDWGSIDLILVDTAVDGEDAYQKILNQEPDIVITDIIMPGLNGLELVEKITENGPDTKFIILSGFDEFEFAQKAMKFNVRHYLLKPTDKEDLYRVLIEVKNEIVREAERNSSFLKIKEDLHKTMSLGEKQFFRNCILNRKYSVNEVRYYRDLFGFGSDSVQLIAIRLERSSSEEELVELQRICGKFLSGQILFPSVFVKDVLLILIQPSNSMVLKDIITRIQKQFRYSFKDEMTVAISRAGDFSELHYLYAELNEYLNYSFYLGTSSIISVENVHIVKSGVGNPGIFNPDLFINSVLIGDIAGVRQKFETFRNNLYKSFINPEDVKVSIVDMISMIIKRCTSKDTVQYIKSIISIEKMDSLDEILGRIEEIILSITSEIDLRFESAQNKLVKLLLNCIEENIGNEELSLKWLSKNRVYAHADYLGKLFKKETGESFRHHLIKVRVENAKKRMNKYPDEPIHEIALAVGFGENSQYFSQVFKRITGYTPTEFKNRE